MAALTREQYNSIMLEYSRIQDRHRHELTRRRHLVYAKIPEYADLDRETPSLAMESLRSILNEAAEPSEAGFRLRRDLDSLHVKKVQLLLENGFPANYLEPTYECTDCHDTGYVDGRKCKCMIRRETQILYDQSHLKDLVQTNNFSLLSTEYYQGDDLRNFQRALETCRLFVRNFDSDYQNLLFYGTVGTGKSFLSICTATDLISSGHSVLYFSASDLFEKISSYVFNYQNKEAYHAFAEDLYSAELLIIDDLGTEIANAFVSGQLFSCINERHLRRKPTIISTNLSLEDVRARYSDRIYSRIVSDFTLLKLTGPDIRVLKKVRSNGANHKTQR